MKNLKLSLVATLAIGICSTASANTLQEALTSGKVSGEVAVTYETRNFDKNNASAYYRDSAYSVGSFALKYETGVWNNLSLTSKFRAYKTLFEDDKNSSTSYGTGDATERFREHDGSTRTADIEELFITYAPSDNFSIKAGRQFISSNWINKTHDAIKIDTSFGDTSLEAIWSLRDGRIYSRDYRPMTKLNENKGVYQVTLGHKFNEMISSSVYGFIAPNLHNIYGVKTDLKLSDFNFGIHYAQNDEKEKSVLSKDSSFLHLKASTTIAGFTPYLGYVKIDDDEAFPGYYSGRDEAHYAGETDVPFEEGDYFYSKGAETYYLGVSKSFDDLSATLLYGETEYLDGSKKKDMNETTLWLAYPLTKDLKANLGYTLVNEPKDAVNGDYDQLNLTLTYSF